MFVEKGGRTVENDLLRIKVRGDDGYRTFSVRVKEQTLLGIEEIVKCSGRSRNEIIGLMLEYALPRIKIESDEK